MRWIVADWRPSRVPGALPATPVRAAQDLERMKSFGIFAVDWFGEGTPLCGAFHRVRSESTQEYPCLLGGTC